MVHLPGACPGLGNRSINDESFGKCFESGFYENCPEMCNEALVHCARPPKDHHTPLTDEIYQAQKGHLVGLFRQPEQRLLSAWYDTLDYFRADPYISPCSQNRTPQRLRQMDEFIALFSARETGQLTGNMPVTLADVPLAIERLREGFAFVGLQEQWELSICLFHAKFGGPCRATDFTDTRPDDESSGTTSEYNTTILNGWVDEIDAPVYAEAKRLFYDDLARYGLSHENCKACYSEANLT
eukprot:Skav200426  [mRNA]  locus=scaffold2094:138101:138823:- [translate_table: standard]